MVNRSCSAIAGASLGTFVLVGLGIAGSAGAQVVNGDFHTSNGTNNTGGFFGWTLDGNNQIQTASIGSGPTGGDKYQALIQNADTNSYMGVSGGTADDTASHFETFVGVSAATFTVLIPRPLSPGAPIQMVQGGSAIQQVVTLMKDDKITFDYDFLADGANGLSLPYEAYQNTTDIAFVHITDGTVNTLSLLGDTTTDASLFNTNGQTPLADPYTYQTATNNGQTYMTYSFTAPEAGAYTLSIGDEIGGGGEVGLLVDNFTFTPATPPPPPGGTPEPGTFAMLGGLLVSGTVVLRRRNRN
jgi:hypothetical protein